MYNLPYYKEKDEDLIKDFINQHPFAFITGCDTDGKPVATQLPFMLEQIGGRYLLRGHMMKNTDHYVAFGQNSNVLVVFSGYNTYVSGTWYSNPHTPSTWNYMSVHAKGNIKFLPDSDLVEILQKTTLYFEQNNKESATIYDNLPTEYTSKLMKAIVAFEIEVTEMDHVFKLSQDRDEESYANIIEQLKIKGSSGKAIAAEMQKRKQQLFPKE